MPASPAIVAPGSRIVVRDAEWVVRRVDICSDDSKKITCEGVSALVRGRQAVFLDSIDRNIEVLDPAKTKLIRDSSPGFRMSRLFIESHLRQAVPSDAEIHVGHRAAMDYVPYQLDPARQALRRPRQRILIADAVGLGKTLEAGVLVAELIARGRGRRILVVAISSMLAQFQKEFWNRFTIPLMRLDSAGIGRVRSRIPTNHNPFYYYDKTIISIDTLKQDSEYRVYLEQAYWDIIVIDEAHNVASRGTRSMRHKLARLLSKRSDTLIMLSATPHDGRAESFASLMNMLDPTAIADPSNFKKEDFSGKGLVVRRFKKDILSQVRETFRKREVREVPIDTTELEEAAYLEVLRLRRLESANSRRRSRLFSISVEKALFSSPAACLDTVRKRISKQEKVLEPAGERSDHRSIREELEILRRLRKALVAITDDRSVDSRYQALLRAIRKGKPFRWRANKPDDRLVIFTERIATLEWLKEGLTQDLRLKRGQVEILHGSMSDSEQQRIVEDFGNQDRKVRLLICSDVASEGINLHHRCHRLIHYDMPWSLMVFQQRNGRIDRYGQKESPVIVYLLSRSRNERIRGDQRIIEVLKNKDKQAYENIGDPSVFMNVHAVELEEEITEKAIAEGKNADSFDRELVPRANQGDELMALFLGGGESGGSTEDALMADVDQSPAQQDFAEPPPPLSLFPNDLAYCEAGLHHLRTMQASLGFEVDRAGGALQLDAPEDLRFRYRAFPQQVQPEDWRFALTSSKVAMAHSIEESRRDERAWPAQQYLWRHSPVVEWLNDRLMAAFGRNEAPVLVGVPGLEEGEVIFVFCGVVLNRKSHPRVCLWGGVVFRGKEYKGRMPIDEVLQKTGMDRQDVPNRDLTIDLKPLQSMLPEAIDQARLWTRDERDSFDEEFKPRHDAELKDLEELKARQLSHFERRQAESRQWESVKRAEYDKRTSEMEAVFSEYRDWVKDTMLLAETAGITLFCVMTAK